MFEAAHENFQLPTFGDLNGLNLEDKIKLLLQWTKKDWDKSELKDSKFRKLCNSLRFWKKKLKPAVVQNNVIIPLYNEFRDIKLDVISVVEALEKSVPNTIVTSFSEFRNPKYLCLYFGTQEEKNAVCSHFKRVDDSHVVFLSWALEESVTLLKVHWLPLSVDLNLIKKEVEKYATIIQEERQALTMLSGRSLPAGKLTFKVKMKEAVSVDAVPHLTVIAEMDALITIQGRQPLCINCNVLGHLARKCKSRFCYGCKKFGLKKHVCVKKAEYSYADVARGDAPVDPDASFSEDEEEEGVGGDLSSGFTNPCEVLGKKIELLQSQLQLQETDLIIQTRLQKKRKPNLDDSLGEVLVDSGGLSGLDPSQEKVLIQESQHESKFASVIAVTNDSLSFDGPSNLAPNVNNRKTYSKVNSKSKQTGGKSQSLFDGTFSDVFTFSD